MFQPDGSEPEDEGLSQMPDLTQMPDDDPDLLGAEQKQAGRLAWRVYQTYWAAVGGVLAAAILMSLLLMQGLDGPPGFSL